MDYFIGVEIVKAKQDAANKEFGLLFVESPHSTYMVPEIPTRHILHDQVEVFPVLKGAEHIDKERVFDSA